MYFIVTVLVDKFVTQSAHRRFAASLLLNENERYDRANAYSGGGGEGKANENLWLNKTL